MNPKKRKASTDEANEESGDDIRHKKGSKRKKAKIPVGLALMHGFSATNVGKSRLTVRSRVVSTWPLADEVI